MHSEVCEPVCSQDRQSSWQNFQKGKVTKKKKPAGFMTGASCSRQMLYPYIWLYPHQACFDAEYVQMHDA